MNVTTEHIGKTILIWPLDRKGQPIPIGGGHPPITQKITSVNLDGSFQTTTDQGFTRDWNADGASASQWHQNWRADLTSLDRP